MLDRMLDRYSYVATATLASVLLVGAAIKPARSQVTPTQATPTSGGTVQQIAASPSSDSYQKLYVNPDIGSDRAQGAADRPMQTVTHALSIAAPNTVIVLAPGRYTQATGEIFPLQLKSGVTIQGTPGERDRAAIIEGGGTFNSPSHSQQNATIVAADRAGIAQVAISNPDGYGLWIESASPTILESAFVGNRQTGIYVTDGSPRVKGSYFSGNREAGLIVLGTSNANIESNTFERTGDAIRVEDGATPEIVGNRMTNNDAGLVLIGDAHPVLRDNRMEGNRRNEVVELASRAQSGLALVPALSESSTESTLETTPVVATASEAPPEIQEAPEIQSETQPGAPIASRLLATSTQNADVVPGDLLGLTTPEDRAPEASPEESAEESAEEATAEATAEVEIASETSAPSIRDRLLNRAQADQNDPDLRDELMAQESAAQADELAETSAIEPGMQPELEADAIPGEIPAGSPGSALAALQAGLPGGRIASRVGVSPRAVSGENPDTSVASPRNRRPEPSREESQPEISRPVNNNRLAVPSSSIPIGSGSSTVFSPPRSGAGAPPAPPSRAQALGLYYRVFVEASDPFVQDEVKAVIPDSFRTQVDGRTMMQVGAFPTEAEAEERQRLLERNDFDARVEYIR